MEWNARVTIRLGAVLELTFETLNLGKAPLMVSGALHTYLRVGDVENIRILGLEDTTYLDTVGERTVRKQEGIIVIDRQVDRIYDSSGSVRLEDPDLKRTILVEKTGSPSTVVWNPWIEKAIALGDLPDDGYEDFVCIEAAIANDHAVEMKSGESHSFSTRIGVA
jgi:glucose-6-phosphate 1-epimerase